MGRRENFQKTLRHETPDGLILDLGGCPLSSIDGLSQFALLDCLGYSYSQSDRRDLDYGTIRHLDERIPKYLDIDTRSVGTILKPKKSLYRKISDMDYIDEWGIQRHFSGLYWDIVKPPLANATIEDLDRYPWPDPETIDVNELAGYREEARRLYEETDYIVCGEHPVYGIFELGCWMCGFENFLARTLEEPEFVERFFEIILAYQKKVIEAYYGAIGPYIHYTSSGDDFATQNGPFVWDGFCDAFGIHSPSTVMKDGGIFLVKGLLNGISSVWSSITGFLGGALDGIKKKFSDAWTSIRRRIAPSIPLSGGLP